MTIRSFNAATGEWTEIAQDAPSFEHVLTPAEALAAWRETADMEKGAFCIGLMRLKVLPEQEAIAASEGKWPQTFADAIAKMPIDPAEAKIIWATTTRVRRLHPILLALIPMSPLTAEQVDAMFGWAG